MDVVDFTGRRCTVALRGPIHQECDFAEIAARPQFGDLLFRPAVFGPQHFHGSAPDQVEFARFVDRLPGGDDPLAGSKTSMRPGCAAT